MWATLFSRPSYLGTLAYVGLALFSRPSYCGDLSLCGLPYLVDPVIWVTLAYVGYTI